LYDFETAGNLHFLPSMARDRAEDATGHANMEAQDVGARLALRAFWPLRPEPAQRRRPVAKARPREVKAIETASNVVVCEDFMSDSGAQDKVLLKVGERGVVKKIIDSGHASIDFEDHKKLQWVSKGNLHKLKVAADGADAVSEPDDEGADEEEDPLPNPCSSSLRRQVLEQLNDALDAGFARRLERLEKKFELLQRGPAACAGAAALKSDAAVVSPTFAPPPRVSTKSLSRALARALRTKPPGKRYGPTEKQEKFVDPPEKDEDVVPESMTLSLTLQCTKQNVASRRRQIVSLREQVLACQDICATVQERVEAACASEKALLSDASLLVQMHGDGMNRRRTRVQELTKDFNKSEEKAKRVQIIFHDQRRYLMQHERVAAIMDGFTFLARHKAGDVALVPQPLPFDEEPPESRDVATAIANPYNVDSWPFEPNVLARRTFNQEVPMERFIEETKEDLEKERLRFRNPFWPEVRLPQQKADDDDQVDAYGAPSTTSRSV